MFRVTRTFRAEMAHRLNGHEGKCQNLHGHSYVFHVTAEASQLDELGRVVDFGELKDGIGKWIADTLDHGTVLEDGDPLAAAILSDGSKLRLMQVPPTAENLAWLIGLQARALHNATEGRRVEVVRVDVWETEHGMASRTWEPGA